MGVVHHALWLPDSQAWPRTPAPSGQFCRRPSGAQLTPQRVPTLASLPAASCSDSFRPSSPWRPLTAPLHGTWPVSHFYRGPWNFAHCLSSSSSSPSYSRFSQLAGSELNISSDQVTSLPASANSTLSPSFSTST